MNTFSFMKKALSEIFFFSPKAFSLLTAVQLLR